MITYSWYYVKVLCITINLQIDSILGVKVEHDVSSKTISLSQPGYIDAVFANIQYSDFPSTIYPNILMSP